jgi:HemX protein
MPREAQILLLAAVFFTVALIHAALTLRRGSWLRARTGVVCMAAAFVCQSLFLHWRGRELGKCPITTAFELQIFVSWAMVLLYFVTGSAYRLSLMGAFTAPLALAFTLGGLFRYAPAVAHPAGQGDHFWGELHAALGLMSYGAMGLAFVAGVMFLVMDRLLKRHTAGRLVWTLPPIHHLSLAIRRLIIAATVMLAAGIVCGWQMTGPREPGKLAIIWVILAAYAGLLGYETWRGMSARRAAWAAVLAFLLPVVSLWFIARR